MDYFLNDMYQKIEIAIDKSEKSVAFKNKLKDHLESREYRFAMAEIMEYRKNNKIEIDENILNKFWDDYAN